MPSTHISHPKSNAKNKTITNLKGRREITLKVANMTKTMSKSAKTMCRKAKGNNNNNREEEAG